MRTGTSFFFGRPRLFDELSVSAAASTPAPVLCSLPLSGRWLFLSSPSGEAACGRDGARSPYDRQLLGAARSLLTYI